MGRDGALRCPRASFKLGIHSQRLLTLFTDSRMAQLRKPSRAGAPSLPFMRWLLVNGDWDRDVRFTSSTLSPTPTLLPHSLTLRGVNLASIFPVVCDKRMPLTMVPAAVVEVEVFRDRQLGPEIAVKKLRRCGSLPVAAARRFDLFSNHKFA